MKNIRLPFFKKSAPFKFFFIYNSSSPSRSMVIVEKIYENYSQALQNCYSGIFVKGSKLYIHTMPLIL